MAAAGRPYVAFSMAAPTTAKAADAACVVEQRTVGLARGGPLVPERPNMRLAAAGCAPARRVCTAASSAASTHAQRCRVAMATSCREMEAWGWQRECGHRAGARMGSCGGRRRRRRRQNLTVRSLRAGSLGALHA